MPICCRSIAVGSVHSLTISTRKIIEAALNVNATTVVLAHNHPGGFAIPSEEDKATTHRLAKVLADVDIVLADHIIVSDDEAISMVASKVFDPYQFAGY